MVFVITAPGGGARKKRARRRPIGQNATTAAGRAGRHPAKRTPPVASSNGCGNLRIASVRGLVGSRGPTSVGRGRTVEAFCVHRAQVGDLAFAQLEPLGFA